MFTECANCGFYVEPDAKSCPDCGVSAPDEPLKSKLDDFDRPLLFKLTAAFTVLIFGGIVFFRLREGNRNFGDFFGLFGIVVLFSFLPALFVSFFVLAYRKKADRRRFAAAETKSMSFRFLQDTISLRDHELRVKLGDFPATKRGARISVDYEKSNRAAAEKNKIRNLIARYDLLNGKIEFARLENKLPRLAERRNDNDEDFSEKLDAICSELELIKFSLTEDSAQAVSESFLVEKQDFLARIEEAEKFCEVLSESGSGARSSGLIPRADDFAVRRMLENFVRSFNESEREFQRLKI